MSVNELVKNLDYALRISGVKKVLIASDRKNEGKSTFAAHCLPLLGDLYKRKILFITDRSSNVINGVDCLSSKDFAFLNGLSKEEAATKRENYLTEISKSYDVVFLDSTTLRRAEKTKLPLIQPDGAVLIRSHKTIGTKRKPVTEEILDRGIKVIGVVYNEVKNGN